MVTCSTEDRWWGHTSPLHIKPVQISLLLVLDKPGCWVFHVHIQSHTRALVRTYMHTHDFNFQCIFLFTDWHRSGLISNITGTARRGVNSTYYSYPTCVPSAIESQPCGLTLVVSDHVCQLSVPIHRTDDRNNSNIWGKMITFQFQYKFVYKYKLHIHILQLKHQSFTNRNILLQICLLSSKRLQ